MKCPICNDPMTEIIQSRYIPTGFSIYRCVKCLLVQGVEDPEVSTAAYIKQEWMNQEGLHDDWITLTDNEKIEFAYKLGAITPQ